MTAFILETTTVGALILGLKCLNHCLRYPRIGVNTSSGALVKVMINNVHLDM